MVCKKNWQGGQKGTDEVYKWGDNSEIIRIAIEDKKGTDWAKTVRKKFSKASMYMVAPSQFFPCHILIYK